MNKDTRYEVHFTPEKGWMNDPNGLIYIDNKYHIFYQHYPYGTKWGPMHWGHAISDDLTNWQHLPIALFPTEDEYIFSGSAVMDEDNISGLSPDGDRVLLLFYTMHNPKTGEQQQGIAFATYPFISFHKYEGNPIIANTLDSPEYKKDFRDPKVVKNTYLGGYTMVLAAGNSIEFYHSLNLINWKKTGAVNTADYMLKGLCECPDLNILDTENGPKAFLSMSLILSHPDGSESHMMPYLVGDFDGKTFKPTQEFMDYNVLDLGPDNYAMVSFSLGSKTVLRKDTIMMGWGENWNDARINTHNDFFGKLTCARRVEASVDECDTARYILRQHPILEIKNSDSCWKKYNSCDDTWTIYDNGYIETFAKNGSIVRSYMANE